MYNFPYILQGTGDEYIHPFLLCYFYSSAELPWNDVVTLTFSSLMKSEVPNWLAFKKLEVHKWSYVLDSGCWDVITIKIWRDVIYNLGEPLHIAFISSLRLRSQCKWAVMAESFVLGLDYLSCPYQLCDQFSFFFSFHSNSLSQRKAMRNLKATHPQRVFIRRLLSNSSKKPFQRLDGILLWNLLLLFSEVVSL